MKIRLLRHATMLIDYGGKKILTDPMLNPAGAADPVPTKAGAGKRRNPLVDLPVSPSELRGLLNSAQAALITHLHFDHFDDLEGRMLPGELPLFCQEEECERLRAIGFTRLYPIKETAVWDGLTIARTEARHGGFYWRRKMGTGSGYVLKASGEPVLYLAGDTIWSPPVKKTLTAHRPQVVVLYAGAAQFPFGRPITMDARDIAKVCRSAPEARIMVVHMEAINHCLLTREELKLFLQTKPYANRVYIPADGEEVSF